ncbi:hypothetical protein TD95_001478 [Thielaviopsis punctulata]|uniref:DUF300 domain protein n=1 Tax=Thielaviopsis punctulata TaxID=72032 RepID=A0A0F4ZJ50_9PEZI|nr:hypothetical protein TD95_001478 [Thielaviopsis punctulata]
MTSAGQSFAHGVKVAAGVSSLIAALLSVVSIWLQTKNYRKPLLQRYVIRILLMVPIFSFSSYMGLVSPAVSHFIDPIRDFYEAFTIYTFFQLLINYLDGERALIIMTHGRPPVQHVWPLDTVMSKVDISDPHTFLAIKRGILQYAWLKPVQALATIIMKACGVYKEGYVSLTSGYFWQGIIYNISVTISLYALGLFWVCMNNDLQPFRPVPKFLSVKLIIFASYWQGFMLGILVWLGAIPDVSGYTPETLAAAIQDALICLEMPAFAIVHWYAFSWKDFADNDIMSARMPVAFAFRDAFGIVDLIQDTKETFRGDSYGYRSFDSTDKIMAHEDSQSRLRRVKEGMRYERGGKGKYWIPKPGQSVSGASANAGQTAPLLGGSERSSSRDFSGPGASSHGTFVGQFEIDASEEELYTKARELEYGDWNYPVITANQPLHTRYMATPRYMTPASSARSATPPTTRAKNVRHASFARTASSHSSLAAAAAPLPSTTKPVAAASAASSVTAVAHTQFPVYDEDAQVLPSDPFLRADQRREDDRGEEEEESLTPSALEAQTNTRSYFADDQDEFRNVW